LKSSRKIGFDTARTELILTYNYVNILISNSITKRKNPFPKLNNIKTFESKNE